MKKLLTILLAALLCLTLLAACGEEKPSEPGATNAPGTTDAPGSDPTAAPTAEPTPVPADIDPSTVDVITETWIATELTFESTKEYDTNHGEQMYAMLDVEFKNRDTGTTLTLPTFWDGDQVFRVRFAPTECGIWDYKTICPTDESLAGKTGTVGCNAYKGELDIYKHGFVTVQEGKKYFTYADGTPFFYLGDTHWSMYTEEMDKAGSHAGDIQTDSHFKYIVDKRVEQGFTVYQSEPIGAPFTISTKNFKNSTCRGFQKADAYYQYIAEKGLVHANAEFFFASEMSKAFYEKEEYMEMVCRYWVARFGAYPVMWTLAQEIDNDFYYERGDQKVYDFSNNPWVKVAEFLHKYDAYSHPLSGHQENTGATTVTGAGTGGNASGAGVSAFFAADEKVGHNWWAAQWSPSLKSQPNEKVAKDYWNNPKPAVDYEGRYCYLWTKNFGARAQGWISFLSGFCGYGYGCIDMWYYKSTYDVNSESNDGIEPITPADKAVPWCESIEFESAYQVGYMRQFFDKLAWWTLIPDFNDSKFFVPDPGCVYVAARTEDTSLAVIYFYAKTSDGGAIKGLDTASTYQGQWFNPRTNEYLDPFEIKPDANNASYKVNAKPDAEDWVLLITK